VLRFGIFLFLGSITSSDSHPIHPWTGIDTGAEISCLAPHLQATIRYNFSVHPDLWNDVLETTRSNETSDIRVIASTQSLMLTNFGRCWLHRVEIRRVQPNRTSWLSQGVTLHLIQCNCSQLVALPTAAANEQLGNQAYLSLRRIVAMIPLSLPVSLTPNSSNAEDATEEHFQGEFNLCSNWNRSNLPNFLKMKVCSHLRHTSKMWLEEDECGDAILYSV